ncbi:transposase [Verrucomicrobia bacterium]|nr:transposase [Verrucomicrobiota bacterium]MDA7658049.1 transposase [Verrucomicrobiota bacterium]
MHRQVEQALDAPYEGRRSARGDQSQLFMDETTTKQANGKAWLWTVVVPSITVIAIFQIRKVEVLDKLRGDGFDGVIHYDRVKMYWQEPKLQRC